MGRMTNANGVIFRLLASLCLYLFLAGASYAQERELCPRDGKLILGDPIIISLSWPLDADRPPELLERPNEQSLEDLFPSDGVGSPDDGSCSSGGITGALACLVIDPIKRIYTTSNARGEQAGETALANGQAGKVAKSQTQKANGNQERITGEVVIRPALSAGPPPRAHFIPTDTSVDLAPGQLTPELANRISSDLKGLSKNLSTGSFSIDSETAAEFAAGEKVSSLSLASLSSLARSANSSMSLPDTISFAPGCAPLINLTDKRAKQVIEYLKAVSKLKKLKKHHKSLVDEKDPIKRLKNVFDPSNLTTPINSLETRIKRAENEVKKLSKPLQATESAIQQLNIDLNEAEESKRLALVRSDPNLLKKEKQARLVKAKDTYREYRNREKIHAATLEEYRKRLTQFDQQIANEKDPEKQAALQDAHDRYERLADSWSDQSRRIIANRFKDMDREFSKNEKDSIGPSSAQGLISQLEKQGENPAKMLEGYQPESLNGSVRRATLDALTLGGSASDAQGAWEFAKDTVQALDEERNKAVITPGDLAKKIEQIARGETTVEQVLKDQKQFMKRFGHYSTGVVKGGVKGLVDLGELAYNASSLQAEVGEDLAEKALSKITGKDVKIDYFGDRRTKAINKGAIEAARFIDKKMRESGNTPGHRGVQFDDLRKDPSLVGELILEAVNPIGPKTGDAIVSGSEFVAKLADRKLARITRGGEKALGGALEDIGTVVGELADLGTAGITAANAARKAAKLNKVAAKLDDAANAATAVKTAANAAPPPAAVKLKDPISPEILAPAPTPVRQPISTKPVKARPPAPRAKPAPAQPPAVVKAPTPVKAHPPAPRAKPAPAQPPAVVKAPPPVKARPLAPRAKPASAQPPAARQASPSSNSSQRKAVAADTAPPPSSQPQPGTWRDPNAASRQPELADTGKWNPKDGPISNGPEGVNGSPRNIPPTERNIPATDRSEHARQPRLQPEPSETGKWSPGDSAGAPTGGSNSPIKIVDPNSVRAANPSRPSGVTTTGDDMVGYVDNAGEVRFLDDAALQRRADRAARRSAEKADPLLQKQADRVGKLRRIIRDRTPIQLGESVTSPYRGNLSNKLDTTPIMEPVSVTPNRNGNLLSGKSEAEGVNLTIRRPDGQLETYRFGERINGGTSTDAYRSLDEFGVPEDAAIRLTEVHDLDSLATDVVGSEILKIGQDAKSHFRVSNKLDGDDLNLVNINGRQYMVAKEPILTDAQRAFQFQRGHNTPVPGAKPPNALEQLTLELSVRDANARGIVMTDHKRQNIAIVKEAIEGGTGYRGIMFDTGGTFAVKGLSTADRAANARHLQRYFDQPRDNLGALNNLAMSQFDDVIDRRSYGRFAESVMEPHPPITPGGNWRRDDYFGLSQLSRDGVKKYLNESSEIKRLLAEQGRTIDDIRIPDIP